jgi:hypothetical protein
MELIAYFLIMSVFGALVVFLIFGVPKLYKNIRYKNETDEERKIRESKKVERLKEREELVNWLFLNLALMFVIIVSISLLITSIIKLNTTVNVKYLILCGFVVGILSLIKLYQIHKKHSTILELLIEIYTSVEIGRLEPSNKTAASEIVNKGVEDRKFMGKITGVDAMFKTIDYVAWGIYLLGTILLTYLFVTYWEYITSMELLGDIKKLFIKKY